MWGTCNEGGGRSTDDKDDGDEEGMAEEEHSAVDHAHECSVHLCHLLSVSS